MKTKISIKNRWTGSIIFELETENNSVKKTLKAYIDEELKTKLRADLTGADLTGADLTGADLTGADLLHFKSDLWRVLLMYKNEVQGLKQSLIDGKVNGSVYTGSCACLKGTIANVKGCKIDDLPNITKSTREPAEQWFLQIKEGQTPENSTAVKLTVDWIEEFEMFLNSK